MDKEDKQTVIQFLFEIANQGNHAEDAIELLPRELENNFSPNEIDAIIHLAIKGKDMKNKCKFAIFMYHELLNDRVHTTPLKDQINKFRTILLLCKNQPPYIL